MTTQVPILWHEQKTAKLRRWKVVVGAAVDVGQELAEIEPLNIKLTSPEKGNIKELLIPNGSAIEAGQKLAILELCLHKNVLLGLCTNCGLDLSIQSIDEGKKKQIEINKRMIAQKKLSLILDLDHTLLHATVGAPLATLPQVENLVPFKLEDSAFQYFVKLRPFLEEFLKEAARYFEIYVYTMGSYTYAQKIVQIITEACHLAPDFFVYNRVVTRDHTKNDDLKDLRALFPTDDSMVLIIDDNSQVWTHHLDNLIKISPFVFFMSGLEVNQFTPANERKKKELEEKIKQQEKDKKAAESNTNAEADESNESKKRAREGDEEDDLPASKRAKLNDDSASSSSDVSTHSSDEALGEEDEENEDENKTSGAVDGEETHGTMTPVKDEASLDDASDIEAASVLEEDAPCIHDDKEEPVKDVEGNVIATSKPEEQTADESGAETPVKVTVQQEQTLAETELKYLENSLNDTSLLAVLALLKRVYQSYYSENNKDFRRDVKRYLTHAKAGILNGAHIVFSHVFPRDAPPDRQEIWIMAQRLGAVCQTEFTAKTTHVIGRVKGTDKVRQAMSTPGVYLVREEWLLRCVKFWRHEPEEHYPLFDLPVQNTAVNGTDRKKKGAKADNGSTEHAGTDHTSTDHTGTDHTGTAEGTHSASGQEASDDEDLASMASFLEQALNE